jgi:hypothetical protein
MTVTLAYRGYCGDCSLKVQVIAEKALPTDARWSTTHSGQYAIECPCCRKVVWLAGEPKLGLEAKP